jgi:hypothetical protein
MLSLHLTAPLLPRSASLPKAGFAMRQGRTTPQLASLPVESDSRQPRPTSRPGCPELEQRQRPRGCSAQPLRSAARSPHECEQSAQPRDATNRQWPSRRWLHYCGSCGVEFYYRRRRHSSIGYLSPIDYERRHHALAVDPDAHQPAVVLATVKDKPSGRPQEGAVLDRRCARPPHHGAGRDGRIAPPEVEPKNATKLEDKMTPQPLF